MVQGWFLSVLMMFVEKVSLIELCLFYSPDTPNPNSDPPLDDAQSSAKALERFTCDFSPLLQNLLQPLSGA